MYHDPIMVWIAFRNCYWTFWRQVSVIRKSSFQVLQIEPDRSLTTFWSYYGRSCVNDKAVELHQGAGIFGEGQKDRKKISHRWSQFLFFNKGVFVCSFFYFFPSCYLVYLQALVAVIGKCLLRHQCFDEILIITCMYKTTINQRDEFFTPCLHK